MFSKIQTIFKQPITKITSNNKVIIVELEKCTIRLSLHKLAVFNWAEDTFKVYKLKDYPYLGCQVMELISLSAKVPRLSNEQIKNDRNLGYSIFDCGHYLKNLYKDICINPSLYSYAVYTAEQSGMTVYKLYTKCGKIISFITVKSKTTSCISHSITIPSGNRTLRYCGAGVQSCRFFNKWCRKITTKINNSMCHNLSKLT